MSHQNLTAIVTTNGRKNSDAAEDVDKSKNSAGKEKESVLYASEDEEHDFDYDP